MSPLKKYRWEATHITLILGVITTLTFVTHLTGTPQPRIRPPKMAAPLELRPQSSDGAAISVHTTPPAHISSTARAAHPPTSDPREAIVGPSGIRNRYTLVSAHRKPLSSTVDELTITLHVASLATENLVSPFGSDMLNLASPGMEPTHPTTFFHTPIPAGNSRNQDVVFYIPANLSLEKTALQIRYYNYQKEIPLNPPSRAGSD